MDKHAYELGVTQALQDLGFLKTAEQPFMSIEEMKRNVYSQQQQGQPLDPMATQKTKGPIQVPSASGGTKPEAEISRASKAVPAPTPKKAPQQAGFGTLPTPPVAPVSPSPYGSELYEKGWGPSGNIQRRQQALRRALNY